MLRSGVSFGGDRRVLLSHHVVLGRKERGAGQSMHRNYPGNQEVEGGVVGIDKKGRSENLASGGREKSS